MKCIGCDTPIPEGAIKCPMCGAPVKREQSYAELQVYQAPVQVYNAPPMNDGIECPKCHTRNAVVANKQGFGLGNAAIGAVLLGPLGILGGMLGSNKLKITCLACNHSWMPGQNKTIFDVDNSAKFSFLRVLGMIAVGGCIMLFIFYLFNGNNNKPSKTIPSATIPGTLDSSESKPVNVLTGKARTIKRQHPAWSDDDCITIASGSINIGMTTDQVKTAWREPYKINKTVNNYGASEQWVMYESGDTYAYFDNGRLTSIQQPGK